MLTGSPHERAPRRNANRNIRAETRRERRAREAAENIADAGTRELYARENVLVLPGSYLSRHTQGENPGANRVRLALVAKLEECVEAAKRIRNYVESLS